MLNVHDQADLAYLLLLGSTAALQNQPGVSMATSLVMQVGLANCRNPKYA